MEKKENENHLKIVHKSEEEKNRDGKKPLSFDELIAEIGTKGTIMEREQVVVENLRRKGLV